MEKEKLKNEFLMTLGHFVHEDGRDRIFDFFYSRIEQNCIKHGVSGKRPFEPDTVAISETERGCLHCGLTIPQAACANAEGEQPQD